MSARQRQSAPYFWVRHFPGQHYRPFANVTTEIDRPEYWLVDFRGGNHRNIFNGQRWHSRRAALHAIALIDPAGQHRIVETP